jgi:PDZ domain-containing protein
MTDDHHTSAGEATAIPPVGGPFAPLPVRHRRWPVVVLIVVIVFAAAVWIASRWAVNYYALTPGDATPVTPLIKVPADLNHPIKGNILLTDVFVTQLNALTFLQERFFSSVAEVVSSAALLGPATPANEFVDQGFLQMSQAQSYATAAALSHLGYTVGATNAGALIYGIVPGSPADHVLKVSQVITAINGKAITSACGLVNGLHGLRAGTAATITVEQSKISPTGVFESGPTAQRSVTLGTPPKGLRDTGCGEPASTPTAYLGIEPQTQQAWNFPVKVHVNTANIGGPSAGLSMTLGIIDKLSGGKLTGNRIVAATGTIDPQGNVGDVGGVREKTIAVERAGATVFFVPPQEVSVAKAKATPQLHVYGVATLDQALKILKGLGGTVPANHLPAQAAP